MYGRLVTTLAPDRTDKVAVAARADQVLEGSVNLMAKTKTSEDWRATREKDFGCTASTMHFR